MEVGICIKIFNNVIFLVLSCCRTGYRSALRQSSRLLHRLWSRWRMSPLTMSTNKPWYPRRLQRAWKTSPTQGWDTHFWGILKVQPFMLIWLSQQGQSEIEVMCNMATASSLSTVQSKKHLQESQSDPETLISVIFKDTRPLVFGHGRLWCDEDHRHLLWIIWEIHTRRSFRIWWIQRHWPLPHWSVINRRIWGLDRSSQWTRRLKHRRCPSSIRPPCTCTAPTAIRTWGKGRLLSRGRVPQHSSAPPNASPHLCLQSKETLRPATTAKSEFNRGQHHRYILRQWRI